jgi:hypothetical protein
LGQWFAFLIIIEKGNNMKEPMKEGDHCDICEVIVAKERVGNTYCRGHLICKGCGNHWDRTDSIYPEEVERNKTALAFSQGSEACQNLILHTTCQYNEGTKEYLYWNLGWSNKFINFREFSHLSKTNEIARTDYQNLLGKCFNSDESKFLKYHINLVIEHHDYINNDTGLTKDHLISL